MPYIFSKEQRKMLNEIVESKASLLSIKGNLNYFLHKLAKETCHDYEDFRNFEGECQQALREIFRRLVVPYENEKIEKNGDVK